MTDGPIAAPIALSAEDVKAFTEIKDGATSRALDSQRLSRGGLPQLANLDLLGVLAGGWRGPGFNLIWRPHFPESESDHFLQLNLTSETLDITPIAGGIPNRGLAEKDIVLFGLKYLQQINDANFPPPQGGGALHLEPGIWLNVPPSAEPPAAPTAVRMGSIPHGTTILAQGTAAKAAGAPSIPPVSIVPFTIGSPGSQIPFADSTLTNASQFRTVPLPVGITQVLVDNPNSLLTDANAKSAAQGFSFVETTQIDVSTTPAGGTVNIPFLGPNADAAEVSSTFWVSTLTNKAGQSFAQLQYSQTVLLNFAKLSWPHVTVGSLVLTA